LAWSYLRTLFASQGANGFMPKFAYINESFENAAENTPDFLGQYPGPRLFNAIKNYSPNNIHIWSSNTIMAPPYHATAILEVFYLSNQTKVDVDNLFFFFGKLKSWQSYLYGRVVMKCIESGDAASSAVSEKQRAYHPCLAISHPWESEIDMKSPIWRAALKRLTDEVANQQWNPTFEVSDGVKTSFDYPEDEIYKSLLYLLECLSQSRHDKQYQHASHDHIASICPFSMIDVGFTSALAKSDQDLRQIQQILSDKNRIYYSQRETDVAESRERASRQMLQALWSDSSGTFLNRVVDLELSNGTYSSNTTTTLDFAVAYNFMALSAPLSNSTMINHMVTQMLQRSGKFSFGCGEYPLRSTGCESNNSAGIFPLLNYRVASGLKRNGAEMEQFIQSSTLNIICGTPNSDESNWTSCNENLLFASAFNASNQIPLGKSACGQTSTLTASIVLDLLSTDKPFRYDSEPPISSSSVIILIAIEIAIAIAIGLSCLFLSLNLVRRANVDEDDTFFNIEQHEQIEQELLVQSPGLSGGYESPTASFDDAQNHFGVFAWTRDVLYRFNPMNILKTTPPNGDANEQPKTIYNNSPFS
jgi:hypothetical protein